MALRGRTNRQVFINKDRKTTPRELVDIKKENTPQLKIIISIYSHRGCCTFLFFIYFYSALISDRRRRDCKLPPLAPVLSMGWRVRRIDQLTRAPSPLRPRGKHQNLDEARRRADAGPSLPRLQNYPLRGAACRPALTPTSPELIFNTSLRGEASIRSAERMKQNPSTTHTHN